jgi:phage/plasmid primase-like uncharacterized protein
LILLPTTNLDDFLEAMQYLRLQAHKSLDLKTDGKFYRYRVEGDKSGSENGWYVLRHFGDIAVGSFGSWKTGDWSTWCSKKDHEFTPQEREVWRREQEAMKQARAAELVIVREKAAKKAAYLWDKADFAIAIPALEPLPGDVPARVHPYILAKGVKPYGVKQMKTGLMVPLRNASGVLTSLQFIQPDGSKKFLTGGEVVGSYFAIGRHDSILCICEGFATGASIREASGFAVAVAFNAGNLLAVAKLMRDKFPDYTIIICADNDVKTEGNPGLSKAKEAAERIGGMFTFVKFQESELIDGKVPTDFNDLHRLRGLDAVREAVEAVAFDEPKPPVVPVEPVSEKPAVRKNIKDFEGLIDDSDDFDWLTDELLGLLAVAELKRPAVEFLISKAAKKASVPKSALMEVFNSYCNDGGKDKPKDDGGIRVAELNHKHAILPVGGRVLILNREYDPVMERQLLTFSAKTDFETRYCNRKIWDEARHEDIGLGTYWLNHANRAEFDGMVFSPGQDQPGYLNLWTGWGIEPAEGSCQKYLEFIFDVICSGDGSLFDYVIHWCAHLVQRPQELPETALVFRGREGIGKNTFIDPLRDIVGREHFLMLSSLNQITGRFSGHLANALLVFCNESVWGGDKSAQGVLKSMITDDVQPIEHKGRDLTMVKSYRRMIFATNENWAVPRGADDRRYVITDVSDARKGDYQYFQAIREEMKNGGTAALMDYLMKWDISDWHPRKIPEHLQVCGWELKIRSGGSIVQWWFDVLQNGWLQKEESIDGTDRLFIWPKRLLTSELQASYLKWCIDYKITHPEHSVVIGHQIKDWGIQSARPRTGNPGRKLFYLIPELEQAQEIFSARFSIPMEAWDSQDVEEFVE